MHVPWTWKTLKRNIDIYGISKTLARNKEVSNWLWLYVIWVPWQAFQFIPFETWVCTGMCSMILAWSKCSWTLVTDASNQCIKPSDLQSAIPLPTAFKLRYAGSKVWDKSKLYFLGISKFLTARVQPSFDRYSSAAEIYESFMKIAIAKKYLKIMGAQHTKSKDSWGCWSEIWKGSRKWSKQYYH